ncbi:MAG: hypothetical protein ACREL7_05740 [Longimicrobiales bacterium]
MQSGYSGVVAIGLGLVLSAPVNAQRVLEMPARTGAGADALARGPIAVFWNPGAVTIPIDRGEAMLMDVRGPSSTGLDGTVIAAALRLDERTTLLAGYQNLRIDEITRTTTSPLAEDGAVPLDLGENLFALAAVRTLGPRLALGAGVQYVRGAEVAGGENAAEIGAGVSARIDHSLHPHFGAAVRTADDGAFWIAGLEIAPDALHRGDWAVRAQYGAGGSPQYHGLSHRVAASASWRDAADLSIGFAGEPGLDGHTWDPVAGVAVRFGRFTVGVLRENLPNDVGAVHAFRLSTAF